MKDVNDLMQAILEMDAAQRKASEKAKLERTARLAALEGNYAVYPGHGDVTNLDAERRQNPAFMA